MQMLKGITGVLVLLLSLAGMPNAMAADGEPNLDAAPTVNINQAGASELAEALDGVGESKAKAIVDYREKNGPFESAEQLKSVNGVGEVTFRDNRDRIRLK